MKQNKIQIRSTSTLARERKGESPLPVWQEVMKYERELIIKFVNIFIPYLEKIIVQYIKSTLKRFLLHGHANIKQVVFRLRDLKVLKSHHVL